MFGLIVREVETIDVLVNSVWGGYEQMVEAGEFTWSKPFWQQPLWRWDAHVRGRRPRSLSSPVSSPPRAWSNGDAG